MAPAGRAQKDGTNGSFHLLCEFKKLFSTIASDTRSQLVAPNVQRPKWFNFQTPKDLIHVLFAFFLGNCADIAGFITIIRASEISMTQVDVSLGAAAGIRETHLNFRR
jgi:hypothetical protein